MTSIDLPFADDLHVHLRQGAFMQSLVPFVRQGGCDRILVMPNLVPPITTTELALDYKRQLQEVDPSVEYLMTLYLTPALTPEEIFKAKQAGVVGVKSYPKGVTTNSDLGVMCESFEPYYPVFAAMAEVGMVLNIHGEVPSNSVATDENGQTEVSCVMNAERLFLSHLKKIHAAFPSLRIVLEHVTTAAAVEVVKSCGPTVGATITVHHLELLVDDWAGKCHNFCKPVAKLPSDREALRQVVKEGHPRFFLGSDSAPHPRKNKERDCAVAGVFTQALLIPYLASTLEDMGALDRLVPFACHFGAQFYGLPVRTTPALRLVREPQTVPASYLTNLGSGEDVVPFRAGATLPWTLHTL